MRLPLHRKITLGFGLALACGILSAQVPAPRADVAENAGTCAQLARFAKRSTVISELSQSCVVALHDATASGPARLADTAWAYLGRLEAFDHALGSLSHPPNDTGAYLIARETGALMALRRWDIARTATQAGHRHAAAR